MHLPLDLRGRFSLLFAGFGAVASLIMAIVLYQGAHDLSERLIDETLSAELDDYIARRERNPASLPPATVILQGYVRDAEGHGEVPAYIASLPVGRHDIRLGTLSHRVAIIDRKGTRYYLLYDTSLQIRREERFALMLGLMAFSMTLLSALGGIWLARTVVAPVTQLAAKVRHIRPEDWDHPLADDFPAGEVGELARVFDRHLNRMRAFAERERAFSSDMSHELRTALAVILSSAEVLLDDTRLDERQKARVGRIDRAARDMAELGTALLLMVREERNLTRGGGCIPADVIRETVEKHRRMLSNKPVTVATHTDPQLVLNADAGLVEILVSNLIRNAFAYTASGTVTVTQDMDALTVSDTGKGLPAHSVEQAFVRHFRDMASEGAGIGLTLVKRICDRYGWQVRLESSEDHGTTVTVRFH
jgi:signal transduction histidine kinase